MIYIYMYDIYIYMYNKYIYIYNIIYIYKSKCLFQSTQLGIPNTALTSIIDAMSCHVIARINIRDPTTQATGHDCCDSLTHPMIGA